MQARSAAGRRNLNLLPVQIEARKQGTTAAPETGLLVKKGDVLEFALAPQFFDTDDNFESLITWHYRQMKLDGSFTEWTAFGSHGTGTKFEHTTAEGGIYEVKATVSSGGSTGDHFYKRKKNDQYSKHKKDDPDCIGVVDDDCQISVREQARINLGSGAYAYTANNPPLPSNSWKCNLFVAHKATDGGATVPWINVNILRSYPPVANQWAGTEVKNIPNWTLLSASAWPQPGYIVARGVAGGTGHTGILDYDGAWISAERASVGRNSDLRSPTYQPARVRKYTGN